jgi:hypothetical protein
MLVWVMLNCILVKTLTSGEVITLIKENSVTCVATENSVVYISSKVPGKIIACSKTCATQIYLQCRDKATSK